MPFTIPKPIKTLTAPLAAAASRAYSDPKEGKLVIPIELDWDGAGSTFEINVQGRTTQPFSQIIMLDVDNTQSGADVTFFFPDTSDTLLVPAYSAGLFPVFTNGLLMYAAAPAALATDVARLRVLNYMQAPVDNPAPEFHQVTVSSGIAPATGTTNVIAAGISGTLAGYSVSIGGVNGAVVLAELFEIVDHSTTAVIDAAEVLVAVSATLNQILISAQNVAIRFKSGIDFVQNITSGAWSGGAIAVTLRYRTP